jgi:hypothetical protein
MQPPSRGEEAERAAGRRILDVLASLLCVGGATVLQLQRQAGVPATDTIWAEDGSVYLADAVNHGPLGEVFASYVGYVQVLPRLLGAIASLLPLEHAPLVFAVGSSLIVALLALYVFHAARVAIPSVWARATLAVLSVLVPAAGWESVGNVVNLQWHLIFPCFLALLQAASTWAGAAAAASVSTAAALTTPIAAVFLPAALWQLRRDPSPKVKVVVGAYLAGVVAQWLVVLSSESPFAVETHLWALPGIYGLRVAGSVIAGDAFLPELWRALGWWFAVGALVVVLVTVGFGVARGDARSRSLIGTTFAFSLVVFAIPVFVRGTALVSPYGEEVNLLGSRWMIAPILFLAAAVLLVLDRSPPAWPAPVRWSSRGLFVLMIGVGIVTSFRVENARSQGPSWSAQLAAARLGCGEARSRLAQIPISPAPPIVPQPFLASIRCDRLDG